MLQLIFISGCLIISTVIQAESIYQEPSEFIHEVFANSQYKTKVIWPDKDLKKQIAYILDHPYKKLRIRYWQNNDKTAWILDETGKDKPITTGIVIKNNKIEIVRILIFRESRGWEIKNSFFTNQFKQATIDQDKQLNTNIKNISGATLSVRAVTKLSRVALLLNDIVTSHGS